MAVSERAADLRAAVAKAAEIQTTMIVNKDRIAVRASTCDGHTHWCATGYGFTTVAVTADSVQLTARTVREEYRTGIELIGPDGAVVASDFAMR